MTLPINYTDENAIRKAFTWATKSGIGVARSSRPIGWYQLHQVAALDRVESLARAIAELPTGDIIVRVFHGNIQVKTLGNAAQRIWKGVVLPRDVFDFANKSSRNPVNRELERS